ncbi:3' terminal RNA ribose 2'-O-methyltransferase Hen1 [Saccharopolyspora subtropica]|uniref:Small RNA 2'-O-methyltransferase n=1 Tax=Saccharopolyspora thermophila TaxID=89367 RepID=A0A917KAJ8_9PSEU|nr:3' terminal RNA ribose 2'-O-methyltransferase Hen1 [Saccharopolyspora subtropica]GGJ05466.1 3' terminal RNA ribose 2'-O-methyltransferase Hen1 [Saccharopolyspora subtropica]
MLITVTTDHEPATDLGFLLHKHPDRAQSFPVAAGTAHVFYPAAGPEECTAALLLEVDPVELVRGRHRALGQYVDDRPYAAGSLLAVALGSVLRTAMNGRCDARPELAATPIPLRIRIPALPCRGGADLAVRLFGPLGWQVRADPVPLDPRLPGTGESRYVDLRLSGTLRVADALRHLYVLIPVLDDAKHYWVGADEVDKLLRAGDGWLAEHPERELISDRYLAHRRAYVRSALAQLAESGDPDDELDNALAGPVVTEVPDRSEPLAVQRRGSVLAVLRSCGARRVLDLGCGDGALLADLLADPSFVEVVGVDVSARALAAAQRRFRRLPEHQRSRLSLRQSALTYVDDSLAGYDAAALVEVVEHLDPERLPALERAVFGAARPATVVVTTPNVEYNVLFENLPSGCLRHPDHRFEWTREEFRRWAGGVAERHGYTTRFLPVGPEDPTVGPPTQLAVFTRAEVS